MIVVFHSAEEFAQYVVEHSGFSEEELDRQAWLTRVDSLYHIMRAQLSQGLPFVYPRAALILWEVVATDECLLPVVGKAMRTMTFAQLCEVVYDLQSLALEQFAPHLNRSIVPVV